MKTLLLAGLSILPLVAHADTVLLNETFPDARRNRQNPPDSVAWYSSSKTGGMAVQKGCIKIIDVTNSAKHAIAYFTPENEPIKLAKGQKLTLSFEMTPRSEIGVGTNSMRFGFFHADADGSRAFTADGVNPEDSRAKGYVGCLNIKSPGVSNLSIFKRKDSGRLLTNSYAYTALRHGTSSGPIHRDQTYKVNMTLSRATESLIQIEVQLTGSDNGADSRASYTDTSEIFDTFDLIGFSIFNSISAADFSNVKITLSE